MSITCKYDGGSFKYRLPTFIEALRIKGDVTRRCRKYMGNYEAEDEIESQEWMAEFILAAEHLFSEVEGVDSYINLYENAESENEVFDAVNKIIDHVYMDNKKKVLSKI